MNKTQNLIAKIESGEYRLDDQSRVYRRTLSGEWVHSAGHRKDVRFRAAMYFYHLARAA